MVFRIGYGYRVPHLLILTLLNGPYTSYLCLVFVLWVSTNLGKTEETPTATEMGKLGKLTKKYTWLPKE